LPFPAVRRPFQRFDEDTGRRGIARRLTGDDDFVAGPQRRTRDRILRQLAHGTPLERPALARPVLVGHINLHERMRITPDELGDNALDFDLLRRVVLRRKRVMREDLTAARDERQAGDQHHNRAFHETSPYISPQWAVGRTAGQHLLPPATCPLPPISSSCYMQPQQTYRSSTDRSFSRSARRNHASAWPP